MTISFPLSLASFFDDLPMSILQFELGENVESAGETGKGEILASTKGSRLWFGAVSIVPDSPRQLDKIIAKINTIREAGATFMVGDPIHEHLENDLGGIVARANTVTVHSVALNNKEMILSGMPDGFSLEIGDQFSVAHSNGSFSYYSVQREAIFDTNSLSELVEVRPHISANVAAGASVQFFKPALKATYVPGSYSGGERRAAIANGVSFSWSQTLK